MQLLVTMEYQGSYYLLFPWADGNLREFWRDHPQPQHTEERALWLAKQCYGLASGLNLVHNMGHTGSDPKALSAAVEPKLYGRHGDMKPENILLFKTFDDLPGLGELKIADFGLTRFHGRESRSNINPLGIPVSLTYRAPECDTGAKVSQNYDIWTLGCLFLEFITWYLIGWNAVNMEFSTNRMNEDINEVKEDTFFKIVQLKTDGVDDIGAVIKPSVVDVSQPQGLETAEYFSDNVLVVL